MSFTTTQLAKLEGFNLAVAGEEREVKSVYCADLLSWAMGNAPEDGAWCTVMGNINSVAVAVLTDISVIVLCEGAVLDSEAAEKALQQGVNIILTSLHAFEAGLKISKAAGLYQHLL